jgi:hypothetical protein
MGAEQLRAAKVAQRDAPQGRAVESIFWVEFECLAVGAAANRRGDGRSGSFAIRRTEP